MVATHPLPGLRGVVFPDSGGDAKFLGASAMTGTKAIHAPNTVNDASIYAPWGAGSMLINQKLIPS
jgi:hypothetical protein